MSKKDAAYAASFLFPVLAAGRTAGAAAAAGMLMFFHMAQRQKQAHCDKKNNQYFHHTNPNNKPAVRINNANTHATTH